MRDSGMLKLLKEILGDRKIQFLDLFPVLEQAYQREGRLPTAPFDDHYDASAHLVVGKRLARWFNQTISACPG